jgi:hypothetical protein
VRSMGWIHERLQQRVRLRHDQRDIPTSRIVIGGTSATKVSGVTSISPKNSPTTCISKACRGTRIHNDQQAIDERNQELRDAGRVHLTGD